MKRRIATATIQIAAMLAFAAADLRAAEVRVQPRCSPEATQVRSPIELLVQSSRDPAVEVSAEASCNEAKTLHLAEGIWQIRGRTAGLWTPSLTIEVRETPLVVELPVTTSGRLVAPIEVPKGKALPSTVDVWVQTAPAASNPHIEGEHWMPCPVDKGHAVCELPVGTLDLAFRIHGYGTVRVWERTIRPATVTKTPLLRFERGSTVSGWIDFSRARTGDTKTIRVFLRPLSDALLNEEQRRRVELGERSTQPSTRGYFQFVTEPGTYVLEARGGALRSDRYTVTAIDGSESRLRQPLRLETARPLTVHVTPARDPIGRPWTVTLHSERDEPPLQRITSENGDAVFDAVFPDLYRVTVGGPYDVWYAQEVETRSVDFLPISLESARVDGTVTMNSEPFRALLTFTDGSRVIRTRSIRDGRFVIFLPIDKETVWKRVEVQSDVPLVRTILKDVRVEPDAQGKRELEIEIPTRGIDGEVVDREGKRVPFSLVNIETSGGGLYQLTADEGIFSIVGLEAGSASVSAASGPRQTVESQRIELAEDSHDTVKVRLVIAESSILRAVVLSPVGPVMGARVWVPASTLQAAVIPHTSNHEGALTAYLPAGRREASVSVAAPGFAFRMLRLALDDDKPRAIFVEQRGGELVVDTEISAGANPYILHEGVILPALAFSYLAGAQIIEHSSTRLRFRAPLVEEGVYTLVKLDDAQAAAAEAGGPLAVKGSSAVVRPGSTTTLTQ